VIIEDYIAHRLREAGVRRFFGIPGGPSIPYMEAFRRAGIEFILTAHETSAAIMADVTGRLTGVPGVCHGTYGPGAVNLATGVGGALLDRSPVIALTSEMPESWLGRTAQMNIDHQALFRPLTKATFRLDAGNAGEVICDAIGLSTGEYPGPVHIGLPSDIAGRSVSPGHAGAMRTAVTTASADARRRAGVLIASSRRPLLVAGLTAMRAGLAGPLGRFLDSHEVAVAVTPMAKGLIPFDHHCYAGVLFHSASDRLGKLIASADLVIGLGYDPVEYNYESWLPDVPLIHFDTRPSDLSVRGAIGLVSGPEDWFRVMEPLGGSPEMATLAGQARVDIRDAIYMEAEGFNPVTVLRCLREMLPPRTTVTADVGSHLHLLGQMWDVQEGRLIMTNGWSSMGFGLPAAIAAAFEDPGQPVVCVTGDGGFLMHAGEIVTARRHGLRVIIIVISDGELNLIKVKQSWKRIKPYGVNVYDGPLFGADRFLGVEVKRVTGEAGLRSALAIALNAGESMIIEAAVDPSVYGKLIVRS
jgi:acetolactate synthase-1/2/3 large subunit